MERYTNHLLNWIELNACDCQSHACDGQWHACDGQSHACDGQWITRTPVISSLLWSLYMFAWFKLLLDSNVCLIQMSAWFKCLLDSNCCFQIAAWFKCLLDSNCCLIQIAARFECPHVRLKGSLESFQMSARINSKCLSESFQVYAWIILNLCSEQWFFKDQPKRMLMGDILIFIIV